ncbi:uncharacterized protein LOC121728107 [Aricia agestis]|uniref:uncharacterized protein LOC121728107 n=1 Tax=Aricia agestis TaxID=91739 RepID=UPI001C209F1C|nr:uncharacterized protein LOC121728107 [Aricia agestis]
MERPLHESRRRELPPVRTVPEGSQSLWSSLQEMDASPSTSEEPLMCSAPPSPALYVECGGSGQSTPQITAVKRPANNVCSGKGEEVPASRRCLIPPVRASSSSSAVRARPLRDEEIAQILNNYGSEEDADSDDEDEDLVQPVQMPRRTERLFMSEEETEVQPINAAIDF